jgi:hypothetical protein
MLDLDVLIDGEGLRVTRKDIFMNKQKTKQEHYLPKKSYLEYFGDPDNKSRLWVYQDKKLLLAEPDKTEPKPISAINLCKEGYMYEAPIYPDNSIENTLSQIEGDYKTILENKVLKRQELTSLEKETVSYFVSTLETRTPAGRDNINGFIDRVLEQFTALEKQYMGGKLSKQHKELLSLKEDNSAFAQSVGTSLIVNRWKFSDYLFMFIKYEGDDQFFITSDLPVSLCDFTLMNSIYGIPPLSATAELIVPLTAKIALFINNIGVNGYIDIDPNFVREVNNRTMLYSNKYVMAPKKLDGRFIDGATKRFRQSFLLLALEEKLSEDWKNRHSPKNKPQ